MGLMASSSKRGCHTQVCCTQSPCPCSSPLLTHTSTGDAQTQFCFNLCGVSMSWCAQGLFEPSECLWWEWDLILNMNSPLLPSCWGFSDFGHEVSPQSHSITVQLLDYCLKCQNPQLQDSGKSFPSFLKTIRWILKILKDLIFLNKTSALFTFIQHLQ